jgi:hypothetical protein
MTPEEACAGVACGSVDDGCGGAVNCGTCPAGRLCCETYCAALGQICN